MNFEQAIERLRTKIIFDYEQFSRRLDATPEDVSNKVKKFAKGISFGEGRKYFRINKGNSVWGFVVQVDNDKRFRYGDILKAANYNTPARNKARGNIFDENYTIQWTGPCYLK